MSLPHFFVDSVDGDEVRVTGDEARHARSALRIRDGEEITVSDGCGTVVRARVSGGSDPVRAAVVDRVRVPAPTPRIVVFPALPKSGKLDLVIEKLTELGVDEIRPWVAARTVVRWDDRTAASKAERWRAIALAASKQSRRARLPTVGGPVPLNEISAVTLLLHEEATDRLRDVVIADTGEIGVVIGPEGGLAPDEVERLTTLGARPAGLGSAILRTETAAIVAAALVLHRVGRLG